MEKVISLSQTMEVLEIFEPPVTATWNEQQVWQGLVGFAVWRYGTWCTYTKAEIKSESTRTNSILTTTTYVIV